MLRCARIARQNHQTTDLRLDHRMNRKHRYNVIYHHRNSAPRFPTMNFQGFGLYMEYVRIEIDIAASPCVISRVEMSGFYRKSPHSRQHIC